MNYVAGWNMGGYSPDPEHLWITDSFESAVAYLLDTVERWWDQDYMGVFCDCPCHPNVARMTDEHKPEQCWCASDPDTPSPEDVDGRYLQAHTDLHNAGTVGPTFSTVVYDPNGYPYTFWIDVTDEEIDDEMSEHD
ncbi:MAG: hypothetical protein ACYCZR_12390 [Burkholderiales bacterium]